MWESRRDLEKLKELVRHPLLSFRCLHEFRMISQRFLGPLVITILISRALLCIKVTLFRALLHTKRRHF